MRCARNKMKKNYFLKIYFITISLCLLTFSSIGQFYNVTTTAQCNPTTGGVETVNFTGVIPTAITNGTLTCYYIGDLSTSETIDFFGESNVAS